MYYMTYCNSFVTGMNREEVHTSEESENMLQFKTCKQAEKHARENGWYPSVKIHSTEEQKICIYKRDEWVTVVYADPKNRNKIRLFALESGIWDSFARPLSITKAMMGGYIATFS